MSLIRRTLASLLAASLVFSGMAQAAPGPVLIGTEQAAVALQAVAPTETHARLAAALDRVDLAAALQARGVTTEQLRARIHALTDVEAKQLLEQIDQAPAGGDILGLVFTVFIVLLVTDILGLTKVFPFTRSVR
jgi:hypothetical protein